MLDWLHLRTQLDIRKGVYSPSEMESWERLSEQPERYLQLVGDWARRSAGERVEDWRFRGWSTGPDSYVPKSIRHAPADTTS